MGNSEEKNRILQLRYPCLILAAFQRSLMHLKISQTRNINNQWSRRVLISGKLTFLNYHNLQMHYSIQLKLLLRMMKAGASMAK
jgi:hypothetical protein